METAKVTKAAMKEQSKQYQQQMRLEALRIANTFAGAGGAKHLVAEAGKLLAFIQRG